MGRPLWVGSGRFSWYSKRMASSAKPSLSMLREIGWHEWDPIGLLGENDLWQEHPAVNEYDAYLLHAVSMFGRRSTVDSVAQYFAHIESERMALGTSAGTKERARKTAEAVMMYLSELSR